MTFVGWSGMRPFYARFSALFVPSEFSRPLLAFLVRPERQDESAERPHQHHAEHHETCEQRDDHESDRYRDDTSRRA